MWVLVLMLVALVSRWVVRVLLVGARLSAVVLIPVLVGV
ncbi:putative membrane protein [Mycobacteroides abscessus 21]|uniref:Putative membrane protein n=1 Tax=Mycobacteroides abscessus 21 TaxID=1299324 RepID=A0A829PWP5_9MYCO|nr:putative membrane protein [Mycobacteroides abscessus 21]